MTLDEIIQTLKDVASDPTCKDVKCTVLLNCGGRGSAFLSNIPLFVDLRQEVQSFAAALDGDVDKVIRGTLTPELRAALERNDHGRLQQIDDGEPQARATRGFE